MRDACPLHCTLDFVPALPLLRSWPRSQAVAAVGARSRSANCLRNFATFGAIGAYLLFKERLGRLQITGVVMLILGVAALTIASS